MGQYEYERQKCHEYRTSRPFYASVSFWSLVIWNLLVIIWAVLKDRPLSLTIWVYFAQNVILGIFWPLKVLASAPDSSYTQKVRSVCIFMPQYLLIHFLYGIGLYNFFGKEVLADFKYILTMAGVFLLSEAVSYFVESSVNRVRPLSLAKVQLFPYARVIPMHLVMWFGFALVSANARLTVMVFLLLKALADVAMYLVEQMPVLGGLVTRLFERHEERALCSKYPELREQQEVCQFCQRVIGRNETPYVIKEHVVCKECYTRIDKERKKTS